MKVALYLADNHPHVGGGYSFLNTIKDELSGIKDIEIILLSYLPQKETNYRFKSISINNYSLEYKLFRIKRKICRLLKITYAKEKEIISKIFQKLFKEENIDILWIPGPFEFDSPVPYIFTIWDIGHRVTPYFPEVSSNGEWENRERLYTKMIYKASYIITGNETGKKEILENYPMNPDKIRVVHFPNPIKNINILNYVPAIEMEAPYIFYPAQFWSHKNHISLIEAVKYLHENNYRIHCYLTGSDKGSMGYIKNKINEYSLEKYIHVTGFVDDNTLVYLYKNAIALTFVSLLGPNNLPPIEAVSLGCPVIISNIPGHIEQMGDAALAVDATDPAAIGNAVIKLLSNAEFRDALISKGNMLAEKQKNYSYINEMSMIFSEFRKIRKIWL
jgi:glycosyltransferase involved in cell wall biosynthesis